MAGPVGGWIGDRRSLDSSRDRAGRGRTTRQDRASPPDSSDRRNEHGGCRRIDRDTRNGRFLARCEKAFFGKLPKRMLRRFRRGRWPGKGCLADKRRQRRNGFGDDIVCGHKTTTALDYEAYIGLTPARSCSRQGTSPLPSPHPSPEARRTPPQSSQASSICSS